MSKVILPSESTRFKITAAMVICSANPSSPPPLLSSSSHSSHQSPKSSSMAASSALCNLFSLLSPSKPPQPKLPPTQLSILQTQKPRDRLVPLAVQGAHSASSSSSIESVICPSLAHANVLFFKSAYNVQVIVDDNEPEERLLGRFRREVMKAGVIQEVKRRRYFENKQDEKKRRTRDAAKRNKRSRRPFSRPFQQKPEVPEAKKSDDDGDNWDLPQGGIPY